MPNYPYYYPTQYNAYPTQMNVAPTQPTQSGIIWVQGEAGAKSYIVGAGQSVLLMDSEGSSFYIKSSDASGMPLPLRIFDYTERTQVQQTVPAASTIPEFDPKDFVTRDEFLKWAERLKNTLIKKGEMSDGESDI